MNIEILLVLFLGGMFFVAALVAAIFVYMFFALKSQTDSKVQRALQEWRDKNLKGEIEGARQEAALRMKEWQEQELTATRRQQQDLQSQMQQWREKELAEAKQQQLEVARQEMGVALDQWKAEHEQTIRADAIQKSRSVTIGKVTEHIVPYLPDFGFNPKDARFIGSPIDFVVFDGLDEGDVKQVAFIEVKTGKSGLSSRERRVRDAVEAGRVVWVELRPVLNGSESDAQA